MDKSWKFSFVCLNSDLRSGTLVEALFCPLRTSFHITIGHVMNLTHRQSINIFQCSSQESGFKETDPDSQFYVLDH